MLKKVKVTMPKKHCIVSSNNKSEIPYVYYATRYYRDENGKSQTDRVMIGKKDEETGLLIPNDNYFELFDVDIYKK